MGAQCQEITRGVQQGQGEGIVAVGSELTGGGDLRRGHARGAEGGDLLQRDGRGGDGEQRETRGKGVGGSINYV